MEFAITFTFDPVTVSKGRKWKGNGWLLGTTMGAYGESAVIWDETLHRKVYASLNFCNDREVTEEERVAAARAYVEHVVQETLQWCRNEKPEASEDETVRFARACLRKRHSDLPVDDFLPEIKDQGRNVEEEILSTLRWASGLRTQRCWMYGRLMPGGKPYPRARQLECAIKALIRKGTDKLPGFKEAWERLTTSF